MAYHVLQKPPRAKVLVLAPHPDDEVLGCGGTLALHSAQGDEVHVLVFYDGAGGDRGWYGSKRELIQRRRVETLQGGQCLGSLDYTFWNYAEGLQPDPGAWCGAVERLADFLRSCAPQICYAPWPGEQPQDHQLVGQLAIAAMAQAKIDCELWGYEVWTPLVAERLVEVDSVLWRKRAALRCHETQLRSRDLELASMGLLAQRGLLLPDGGAAEAFCDLGPGYG